MKSICIAVVLVLYLSLSGCLGKEQIYKPKTLAQVVMADANQSVGEKALAQSREKLEGLPKEFIWLIAGGVGLGIIIYVFFGKIDIGAKAALACICGGVGTGLSGLWVTITYQKHAELFANWGAIIVLSFMAVLLLIALIVVWFKYIKTNTVLKEVVVSAVPAFEALKSKVGAEVAKATVWVKQSDVTIEKVRKIKSKISSEK